MLQRARDFLARSETIARVIPIWSANRERDSAEDYEKLARDGYCRNVVLYAGINEIAKSAGEPELIAERRVAAQEWARVPDTHRLARLASRPNPEQSGFEFIESTVTPFGIGGESLTHTPRSTINEIVEMWSLRPSRVKPVPDSQGFVQVYRYKVTGAHTREVPAADIVHMKRYHPLNDYRGLSPFSVVRPEMNLDGNSIRYLESFFLNAAVPFGLLKVKANAKRGSREALQAEMEEKYGFNNPGIGGILRRNWHRFLVIGSEADYQPIGSKLDQLKLDGVFSETESRLCAAIGVPPLLVGVWIGLMRSTYSNYIAMMRDFWERTLIPMYRRIETKLTTDVAHEWGPDFRFRFDLSTVKALQEAERDVRQLGINGWNAGLLSRDEARLKLGETEIDGDTKVFKQATNALLVTKEGELQKGAVAEFNRARQAMIDGLKKGEVRLVPELTTNAPEVREAKGDPEPEAAEKTWLAEIMERHDRVMLCGNSETTLGADITDRDKFNTGILGQDGDTPPGIGFEENAYYWIERLQAHVGPWLLEGTGVFRVLRAGLRDSDFEPDAVIYLHGRFEAYEIPEIELEVEGLSTADADEKRRRQESRAKAHATIWAGYVEQRDAKGSEIPIYEGTEADFLAPKRDAVEA